MKVYQTNEIRNIALVGNAGCGKTTLAETMLFLGGVINRRGDVISKNTVSDYREVEQIQQNSIFSSVLYTEFAGNKINILDAPGADDFVGGVISSMHVADTVVLVLNSQNGIEVGAEVSWRNAARMHKPVIILANHVDHDNVNFEKLIDESKDLLSKKLAVVQYPVNAGPDFNAVIDVVKMKMLKWKDDSGKAEELEVPKEEKEKAEEYLNALVELAAESEESLMEIFFEKGTLTEEEMKNGLKKGIINRDIFPVFCSSAKRNYGVQRFMEFICNVAPSPDQMPAAVSVEGTVVPCDPKGLTSLFVFKSSLEQHVGEILYFKVMSGEIVEAQDLINKKKSSKERMAQIFCVYGKNRVKVPKICAGDIGATVKLKDSKTDHTLCTKEADWVFDTLKFPSPKHRTAIKANNEADEEKLAEALYKMRDEDPTLIVEYSKELKQMLIYGQGEHHLNIVKWHLDNIYKIDITFLAPRIQYRETITKPAQADYRHKKQSGGAGQFGEVHMVIEPYEEGKPDSSGQTTIKTANKGQMVVTVRGKEEDLLPWGGKLVFYNCIVGGVIEARFMPAIKKGIMEKLEEGPLTGSYARDIQVYVYDGKMHPVDSNEISFKLAGLNAFKEAFKIAGPKILEPIYNVEVRIPSDRMGDVMSDLQGRRAVIMGMENEGRYEILKARVPLAEMNKYSTALSSNTSGRASYTMEFSEYAQVPPDVQEKLLKTYEDEHKDE